MKTPPEKTKRISVKRGSSNVFADIGFQRDAADLSIKAELTRQIYIRIKHMALTQAEASARLGISQPDVSKLMNGRFVGYSVDRLMAILSALEVDVDIVVRPRAQTRKHTPGVVRVMEAVA